jgi:hypothetical protein
MSHREIHSSLAPTSQPPTHSAGSGQAPDPRPLLAYFSHHLDDLADISTLLTAFCDGFDGWQIS